MKPLYIREDAESQRRHLSAVGRCLGRRGRLPGTFGSVSVRSGEAVLITAGGLDKRVMTPQDVVMVDPFDGLPLTGEFEWPPEETALHLALYRRLPDCGAVIHAQAPGRPDGSRPDAGLPVLPVATDPLDVSRLVEDVTAALAPSASAAGTPPALLFRGNGLVTWGRDTDEALGRLESADPLSHPLRADAVVDGATAARADAR
ncbi:MULTISPECIES: class II aldolase/adducin family protein [unclassified Streptomyces]|uniref:class II aldolase/adducin family protein n=1 Tax=unclassified Streptomyces TaxID=2593676 RepID=UPI002E772561|nr:MULTISPECIES: class II aldolase/adducin family protein [unclassified Streptomyces]MEE1762771.1 class II aldolase/adducin family protein [Streptomyces sp. SP18BB07]MEE1830842.1 class II aldolase/adducin family protein [Streptomyces sp. SP17KL33]